MSDREFAPLLDAFGRVLAAYAQGTFDVPGRSAAEAADEVDRWRRHALLGTPVEHGHGGATRDRDFAGAARVVAEHRQSEKAFIDAALKDLREALWACVQRVHAAVQADLQADEATAVQIDRVQAAINRLETGAVKNEVLEALTRIEAIAHERNASQQAVYSSLAERIESLGSQLHVAVRESETDALTGLGNRKRFTQVGERVVHMHTLHRAPVTLLMMDLDGLKAINDTLGHSMGDTALSTFAACLPKVFLRESDELCRIGGDEFVALLPNTTEQLCGRLAQRLIDALAQLEPLGGPDGPSIQVSVGYAELRAGEDMATWLARTDAALYRAKAAGKGRAEAA